MGPASGLLAGSGALPTAAQGEPGKSKILREKKYVFFAESTINLEIHPFGPDCNAVTYL